MNKDVLYTYDYYGRESSCYAPLELFAVGSGSFDYYYSKKADESPYTGCLLSIPKPGTGGEGTGFGDLNHVRRLMREGYWNSELTPLGKRLMGYE